MDGINTQKTAVISDIHGNIEALEAVADDIRRRGIKTVVNLGDHVSGPLWPSETARFLMRQDWINISGNHDRIIISNPPDTFGLSDKFAYCNLGKDELDWLKTLPAKTELPGGILLFHGAPMDDTAYLTETVENGRVRLAAPNEIRERLSGVENPVMLCGHTHLQRIVVIDEKITIINPGSVGLPAYDDDQPEYHVVESGSPHAKYAIMELENNRLTASLISIPYNHSKAVSRAEKNNRPDWVKGLSAGYMR